MEAIIAFVIFFASGWLLIYFGRQSHLRIEQEYYDLSTPRQFDQRSFDRRKFWLSLLPMALGVVSLVLSGLIAIGLVIYLIAATASEICQLLGVCS